MILKEIDLRFFDGDPELFFEETQAVCAAACDRVVPLYVAGRNDTHICLTMPIMAGSLAKEIRDAPIPAARAIAIGQDICDGVGAVHRAERLHLDLKPANVLLDAHGRGVIADFGQAMRVDGLGIAISEPRMYEPYWPPEVFAKKRSLTVLSDVYQIGLTLYAAVNGDNWYRSQLDQLHELELAPKILDGTFPDRDAFLPHVPDHLRRVIRKATALKPSDRFESAADLSDALGDVDPKHPWRVTQDDHDGYAWVLDETADRSAVKVYARFDGKYWSVEVWTQTGDASPRKRAASSLWGKKLTWVKANTLLKRAFRSLP
ncbi:Hypothetical protein I5071_35780 [Sandaracinus amylolyticus]|nr:Hypothetical protein I5071_35780 [Sandaracinus amylolyticus]